MALKQNLYEEAFSCVKTKTISPFSRKICWKKQASIFSALEESPYWIKSFYN